MVDRVVIANRGEVAVRILQAVHEMGLTGILVVSDQDRASLAARNADELLHLPGTSLSETYLNAKAIVEGAKKLGATLLHPGFGFLSEDSNFAKMVQKAGIHWIGPSPKSMEAVSDKYSAKKLAETLKVPTAPWILIEDKPSKKLIQDLKKSIGFPCLVKAVSGGGGKGLKIVHKEGDLADAISSAQREAKNAFGDDRVFIEKIFTGVRHIEIQIFGDCQGNVYAFGERECSAQRRFQKVIEESPAYGMTPKLRETLEQYAIQLAKKISYQNAGTVEFLLDGNSPYFLEVNTRLQVEHGVTEERYGLDLVKMQIMTALEKPIKDLLPQQEPRGHVIEFRLYAEDPHMHFLPQPGKIEEIHFPFQKGLRIETGIEADHVISGDYDPMIAKLIVCGLSRNETIQKSLAILQKTQVLGPTTNRDFLMSFIQDQAFQKGKITTDFIEKVFMPSQNGFSLERLARALAKASVQPKRKTTTASAKNEPSAFQQIQYRRSFS